MSDDDRFVTDVRRAAMVLSLFGEQGAARILVADGRDSGSAFLLLQAAKLYRKVPDLGHRRVSNPQPR